MHIDPWILTFSAATVIATIWMGFWSARKSKTAHDFFVAGRSVSVGWNASAISGEYLSAASFMGVAGMVMSTGYDALWYPVCYACGYLFLLLFIAGPLRRFGAYTIPDFAEGRFDSPLFRKIAVVFVLFIGFFYTMPQMKGAGTTLSYIFQDVDLRGMLPDFLLSHDAGGHPARGLPYWVGVALVGAVITLNVALGGMKGITLVQAFQYWAKMFAISVPIFVLMSVYGHYGKQLGANAEKPVVHYHGELIQFDYRESGLVGTFLAHDKRLSDLNELSLPVTNFYASKLVIISANFVRAEQLFFAPVLTNILVTWSRSEPLSRQDFFNEVLAVLKTNGITFVRQAGNIIQAFPTKDAEIRTAQGGDVRKPLPEKAPKDSTWISPFGPLTTKAAKTAAAALTNRLSIPLRADLAPTDHLTAPLNSSLTVSQAVNIYADLTGRLPFPRTNGLAEKLNDLSGGQLSRWRIVKPAPAPDSGITVHGDGYFTAEHAKKAVETFFLTNGFVAMADGKRYFKLESIGDGSSKSAIGNSQSAISQAWLAKHERPLALLYTYSLIIALVCGTAGLPHILVRFYTNPDGVAAKRTTMWVMILIGVFYLFPPVFGVMGRNLLPALYAGVGAKGTDKVVLELPRILNDGRDGVSPSQISSGENVRDGNMPSLPKKGGIPWGSILSGITCAGAFAAFMSTFSGLLVSMTGALAHDVYGRMFRPKSTPEQRLRAFKICAVICGVGAILLGFLVETFEINKMVGWAFAIAATSYFPLLFLSTWWRRITMKGAATGMLIGGTFSLVAIASTMFADQAKWAKPLADFYAMHPLIRILAEQPAIWALPLAMVLMIVISKLTRENIPSDIRMKMLVLHAPEKLGLKQEYIQEHQAH